jgi:hypothetical protein
MVEGAQGRVKELEAQVAELRAAAAANEKKLAAAAAAAAAAAVAGGAAGAVAGSAGATARERALREELESTLREFEELTRAGVEAEREREELERTVDRLRDSVESLEARLSEERIGRLGGSKGSPGAEGQAVPAAGSTSTMVLRNEFKKMMKDARAEHQKALKVCLRLRGGRAERLIGAVGAGGETAVGVHGADVEARAVCQGQAGGQAQCVSDAYDRT